MPEIRILDILVSWNHCSYALSNSSNQPHWFFFFRLDVDPKLNFCVDSTIFSLLAILHLRADFFANSTFVIPRLFSHSSIIFTFSCRLRCFCFDVIMFSSLHFVLQYNIPAKSLNINTHISKDCLIGRNGRQLLLHSKSHDKG